MSLQRKEIERLRWEYTRRSTVFKEIFEWLQDTKKNPETPVPEKL